MSSEKSRDLLLDKFLRECKRCGHIWFGRKDRSIVCPKCHSALWEYEKNERLRGGYIVIRPKNSRQVEMLKAQERERSRRTDEND